MMPLNSWSVPGRNPGTSTRVMIGMLNASQKRTNRAAFSEAAMSRVPANCSGWFATTPTLMPSRRARPVITLGAYSSCSCSRWPSSTIEAMTSSMS